ncbi:MAG: SDR family NAD(P)-dependent oxidoreductase [Clostridiales bacterium]|nr:SDR family NAD(P)-dependent oxidoreductase [Clostridiales bacterium]
MLRLNKSEQPVTNAVEELSNRDVAVIGISLQMPLADQSDSFWDILSKQVDCVRDIPYTRLPDICTYAERMFGADSENRQYSQAAFLHRIDYFDYKYFGLSPKEASLMNPPQRLSLQSACQAIEDAGYSLESMRGSRTGVYFGFEADDPFDYKRYIGSVEPESLNIAGTGNLTSIISGRISYMLDLKGPSVCIDTACSSSLVAVHMACQAIRNGDCEAAVVGSVRVNLLPIKNQLNFGATSSSGRAKTFDDHSDGTGSGEGVITVLLKPLGLAVHDRDSIYGVLKGSACNQDGNSVGLTAPNVMAQRDVLLEAWKDAKIEPQTISYIEAHGTGTKLGDPIEIDAINQAFRQYTDKRQFCAVSSLKTNIGHLDNAAGLAGLIKALLSLSNKKLPGSLHFNSPNRNIPFEETAVYVNDITKDWITDGGPRRCGVSSFGFSGTNCHIVMEEAPTSSKNPVIKSGSYIFALSAKSEVALELLVDAYIGYFARHPGLDVEDICFTVCTGRQHHPIRLAMIVQNTEDIVSQLVKYRKHLQESKAFHTGQSGEGLINWEDVTFPAEGKESVLIQICEAYVCGKNIDWQSYYGKHAFQRIHLPPYQFEPSRCWINPEHKKSANSPVPFYEMAWENEEIQEGNKSDEPGAVVVFHMAHPRILELIALLRKQNKKVFEIIFGMDHKTGSDGEDCFYISENATQGDWIILKKWIGDMPIQQVIHATSFYSSDVKSLGQLRRRVRNGAFNALRAIQTIVNNKNLSTLQMVFMVNYADTVDGLEEHVYPENAALFGLASCLSWEQQSLNSLFIDIDDSTHMACVIKELSNLCSRGAVAYRSSQRFVKKLNQLSEQSSSTREAAIKQNGVYVIAGGAGGIGRQFVNALYYEKANIALIGRSDCILPLENGVPILVNPSIKQIQSGLKDRQVLSYHVADISDEQAMKQVLSDIRQAYGSILGVINCAGISSGDLLQNDTVERYERVFSPKIYGTWILDRLTRKDHLDFFVCSSSAITLIGGIGSGAYTSANCYLDAFANARARKGKRSLTLNFPAWRETGMAQNMRYHTEKELFQMLLPVKGVWAFLHALTTNHNRVIVGQLNESSSILQLKTLFPFKLNENISRKIERNLLNGRPEPLLPTDNNAPIEGKSIVDEISAIWKEVLGYDTIDIQETFFALGGDSILMTRVYELMRGKYPVSMADLFTYPTISKLSAYLKDNQEHSAASESDTSLRKDIMKLIQQVKARKIDIEQAVEIFCDMENQP